MVTADDRKGADMSMQNSLIIKAVIRLSQWLFRGACPSVTLAAALLTALFLFSCTDAAITSDDEYLIRVSERVVTVSEFNKTFEITKSAYPRDLSQDSVLLKEVQVRMLNQMIEELLVLQRASELRIELTEPEVARAIANIKADYPEGVFEQTLLEYAVSYNFWEKRLKTRLMMEKVVEREVHRNVVLTPEDIATFYKENFDKKKQVSSPDADKENIEELIVKRLRRQKAEEAYQLWIKNLKEKYPVDINQSQWKRLTGL